MEIIPFTLDDQLETALFIKNITSEMGWPEAPAHTLDSLKAYFHILKEGFLFLVKDNKKLLEWEVVKS